MKDRFGSQRAHKRCIQPAEGARAKGCRWQAPAQCRQVGRAGVPLPFAFGTQKVEKSPQGGHQNKQLLGYQYSRAPPAI